MHHFPNRKMIRMQGFDYGSEHTYFITGCAYRRQHLFGEIRNGVMCLNDLGAVIWSEWEKTFEMRPHYLPHAFVVMPNHFHALFSITRTPEDIWNDERIEAFSQRKKDTVASTLGGIKSAITSYARKHLNWSDEIWQSRFHDHVVRDWAEFGKIEGYIFNNVRNWRDDCFYD